MITKVLRFEEGYREHPYHCSEGYPTIGIGLRIGPKGASLKNYEIEMPLSIAEMYLTEEVIKVERKLMKHSFYNADIGDDRKTILLSMSYQLGVSGLLKFKNMIKAIERGDWERAKIEALDSRWARQTPYRARRHAEVLRTGDLMATYRGLI